MFLSVIIAAEITLVTINVIVYTLRLHLIYHFSHHILVDNSDNNIERNNNSVWKSFSLKFKQYMVSFIDDFWRKKDNHSYGICRIEYSALLPYISEQW